MKRNLFALLSGLLFGAGLSLSGMTDPSKVQGFLDIFGAWQADLIFVMGGALITTFIGFKWVFKRQKPLCESQFHLPENNKITPSLIIGAICFGIGWGLIGYCPGPALAALGGLQFETLGFVASMFVGMAISKQLKNI